MSRTHVFISILIGVILISALTPFDSHSADEWASGWTPQTSLPPGELGKVVALGKEIVENTGEHPLSKPYVNNALTCSSCHLDAGTDPNGIYIEPDVEYIETYKQHGEIANCAGDGLCGYTPHGELAAA